MTAEAVTPRSTGAGSWLRWAVSAVFGLMYSYFIWLAFFSLQLMSSGVQPLNALGWTVTILPVVFPAVAWVAAFLLGRRRRVWQLALLFVVGLCLTAVFWINIINMQATQSATFLG